VASAVVEGYAKNQDGAPTPYHGYYYRILTLRKNGAGGAKSYIVDGKMTGGVAFIAYPAEYRSSGVMTFIINEDGVVYQKDLGKKSDVLAKAMKEYNPNSSWQKGEDEQEESAGERQNK
jgi:deoxyxylulose-5-phosphate synthase